MKNLFITCTIVFGALFSVTSQVEESSIIIDTYYGFPNLYTSVLRSGYETTDTDDFKISGYGPVGVRGEYMFSDKIGVGVDFMINSSKVSYSYDDFSSGGNTVYTDEVSTTKIGLMATFNYHFVSTDRIDFFAVVGAGFKNRSWGYKSTNPDLGEDLALSSTVVPIAGRIGVGTRIFFTQNLAANVGLGFGQGGVLNAGLSLAL